MSQIALRAAIVMTLGFVVLATMVVAPNRVHSQPAFQPNIVFIMTDDQDAQTAFRMPEVRALLAEQGASFTRAFATTPLCCPSRSSFLSGQHTHNHQVWYNLPPDGGYGKFNNGNTLPIWLQSAGYHTVHIGKYLNGYGIQNEQEIPPGWSEWYGLIDLTTYLYYGYKINENGTPVAYDDDGTGRNYQTDVLAVKALSFIQSRQGNPAPFFLSVAFMAPHAEGDREDDMKGPVVAPRHQGIFDAEALPTPPSFDETDVSDKPPVIRDLPQFSQEDFDAMSAHHRNRMGALLAVDEGISAIVHALEAAGMMDRTVIIFMSDNGYLIGEHRVKAGKEYAYEEAIRLPLVIRGPGLVPRQIDRLVNMVDVTATIVEMAGATPGLPLDGHSLVPLMADPNTSWRTDLLIEGPQSKFSALRTERFVYVEYVTGEREMYDLDSDPFQLNSDASAVSPEVLDRLAFLRSCAGSPCWEAPAVPLAFDGLGR